MTVSGFNTPSNHLPCLPTLSDQTVNVSSADDFAPDLCSRLLSYHHCYFHPLPYQAVNVFSIDKSTNRRSYSISLSTSSQTLIGADTPQSHNSCFRYSYNSCHHLNIADSLKIMSQKLLRPKNWVSPTVLNVQKEFAKLPTIDISIIRAALFNTLVQQASHARNMEIFNISIRNIEKALAPKSNTNPAKKLPTEYHDFFDIFFRANSDILPPYRPYDHKIPLMEEKTPLWYLLYSMF